MKTLQAQRLKKLREWEYQHRSALMEQILEEAHQEMEKLQIIMGDYGETISIFRETDRQSCEEYREDGEAVYFEQGIVER